MMIRVALIGLLGPAGPAPVIPAAGADAPAMSFENGPSRPAPQVTKARAARPIAIRTRSSTAATPGRTAARMTTRAAQTRRMPPTQITTRRIKILPDPRINHGFGLQRPEAAGIGTLDDTPYPSSKDYHRNHGKSNNLGYPGKLGCIRP